MASEIGGAGRDAVGEHGRSDRPSVGDASVVGDEEEWPDDPTALAAILENDGRPSLLSYLKTLGITKLSERQKIANALGRGLRGRNL